MSRRPAAETQRVAFTELPQQKRRGGPPIGSHNHASHGLGILKRAFREFGSRAIDKRSSVGRNLQTWKADIIRDLGGDEVISAQEQAVLDVVVRLKLMLDSIDGWILTQPSLLNKRKKALLPVVRERNILSDSLVKHLQALGLKRAPARVQTLAEYLATKQTEAPDAEE